MSRLRRCGSPPAICCRMKPAMAALRVEEGREQASSQNQIAIGRSDCAGSLSADGARGGSSAHWTMDMRLEQPRPELSSRSSVDRERLIAFLSVFRDRQSVPFARDVSRNERPAKEVRCASLSNASITVIGVQPQGSGNDGGAFIERASPSGFLRQGAAGWRWIAAPRN